MLKDTEFYNKESTVYSEKRYPKVATSYTQFFFKERLKHTLLELQKNTVGIHECSLFEIGCADGIVLKEIHDAFGNAYSPMVGIDISPGMIAAAKEKFGTLGITFKTRQEYTDTRTFDAVIEIGVINYANLTEELEYIAKHINPTGVAIISLAGTGSLWDKTRKSDTGFATFLSYHDYEAEIAKRFTIVKAIPVGLPLPVIWRAPAVARVVEGILETLFRPILPNLFHEKVYVLKLIAEPTIEE
jgi:2-polyprenyl-3-methyl-5-hydroxy-6-metoxy-1,4-benzoquinol methylase